MLGLACYPEEQSFWCLHFWIAAKIRLDLMSQINPQCNSQRQLLNLGLKWIWAQYRFLATGEQQQRKARWMVPQLSMPFQEGFSLFAQNFFFFRTRRILRFTYCLLLLAQAVAQVTNMNSLSSTRLVLPEKQPCFRSHHGKLGKKPT